MGDDWAAIEAWLAQVTEPLHLAENLGHNYLLHHNQIKASIADTEADWSAGRYFASGTDLAVAIVELLGPIEEPAQPTEQTSLAAPHDPLSGAKFIAGFLYGISGEDQHTELVQCVSDGEDVVGKAEALLAEIEAGSIEVSYQLVHELVGAVREATSACEDMNGDWLAIWSWGMQIADPIGLSIRASHAWLTHHDEFKRDVALEHADYHAGNYFKAGVDTADICVLLAGPPHFPEPPLATAAAANLDLLAVPDFAAGMLYGFTGDNQLPEVEACFAGGQTIEAEAAALLRDLEAHSFVHAMKDGRKLMADFHSALASCEGMDDDLQRIAAWAEIFT